MKIKFSLMMVVRFDRNIDHFSLCIAHLNAIAKFASNI